MRYRKPRTDWIIEAAIVIICFTMLMAIVMNAGRGSL